MTKSIYERYLLTFNVLYAESSLLPMKIESNI
jgi:hypothetical protein